MTLRFLLFALAPSLALSQNLVPNGDFESHRGGESGYANINLCRQWLSANAGTPDYYSSDLKNYGVSQSPHGGSAFAGLIVLDKYPDILEYLQIQLSDTLYTGRTYHFRMFAALSPSSPYATRNIGVLFTEKRIRLSTWTRITLPPQIRNSSPLTQPEKWALVEGHYTAKGGEKYITIGNFDADADILRVKLKDPGSSDILSYYYIDDVSLHPVSQNNPSAGPASPVPPQLPVSRVYFHFDTTELLPESARDLDTLSAFLLKNPSVEISLSGHADAKGTGIYNKHLSAERSSVIQQYLIRKGIRTGRISRSAFGDTAPAADNHSEEGRQQNRRVEFRIVKF
jgi:OmpA-OmpF porin, OOP family